MGLPEPQLADLRFQRIVDDARRRIMRFCPDWKWTEYNLSDPGITLVELFAWMTEMMTYRLDQVPEKNYIRFLNLLGVTLLPPRSASADLTFYLSKSFSVTDADRMVETKIPSGTEVAARSTDGERELIFTTERDQMIRSPKMTHLAREGDRTKFYYPIDHAQGRVSKAADNVLSTFLPFGLAPTLNQSFYIGFDKDMDISGYVLRLTFKCLHSGPIGIDPNNPPLKWRVCCTDDEKQIAWRELKPSQKRGEQDTTNGFNSEDGIITFHLPQGLAVTPVGPFEAYWLKCSYEFDSTELKAKPSKYSESPKILNIDTAVLGAAVPAKHATRIVNEILGYGTGEPGQRLVLQHAPVLELDKNPRLGETLELEVDRATEDELTDGAKFERWKCVSDFAESDEYDRHYTLDIATGEVCFGPAIRQTNGEFRQYGRVPEAGRRIRFANYWHGGGAVGNVPVGRISVLKTSIPYIDHVVNLAAAERGRDLEVLDEAKLRARREIRERHRAVTAEDVETIVSKVSGVGRVKCLLRPTPLDPKDSPDLRDFTEAQRKKIAQYVQRYEGTSPVIDVLVVPDVVEAIGAYDWRQLRLSDDLRKEILGVLEPNRVLTTSFRIRPPSYVGVSATVHVVTHPPEFGMSTSEWKAEVEARVDRALQNLIAPMLPRKANVSKTQVPTVEHKVMRLGTTITPKAPFSTKLVLPIPTHPEPAWPGWGFGEALHDKNIYAALLAVPGVRYIEHISFRTIALKLDLEEPFAEIPTSAQPDAQPKPQVKIDVSHDTLLCSLKHFVKAE